MQFFLQAIGIGFLLSVMVGPVFFVLLETSITKGIRAALALDIGVYGNWHEFIAMARRN